LSILNLIKNEEPKTTQINSNILNQCYLYEHRIHNHKPSPLSLGERIIKTTDLYSLTNSNRLSYSTCLFSTRINYLLSLNYSLNNRQVFNVSQLTIPLWRENKRCYSKHINAMAPDSTFSPFTLWEGEGMTEFEIIETFLKNIKLVTDSSNVTTTLDCQNFSLEKERLVFRKKISKVSGIYMLKCKLDSRLFYIGQAVDLSNRLGSHFSRTELETTKLGNMIRFIGWNNLSAHILEFCDEKDLILRENNYIEKYLPTLNGKFTSNNSKKIHRTLRSVLKYIQLNNRKYDSIFMSPDNSEISKDLYDTSNMWVYEQLSEHTLNLLNNKPFENLQQIQTNLNINAKTINIYADTYVSYKNYFFFTKEIKNISIIIDGSRKLTTIGLNNYLPKKIWTYYSDTLMLVNNNPFNTIKDASIFIGTSRSTIINILNRNIAMSKGFYCFTRELNEVEINYLKDKGTIRSKISSLSKSVWVYSLHTNNLMLVNNRPFQSQQEMLRDLKLKRIRTVNKYKDTGINFKGFYFFSKNLSSEELERLKTNTLYAKPNKKSMLVWAYKNNQLINNRPFISMASAGKELTLDRKLIRKYLDSNISYKGYLFYSNILNSKSEE